MDKNIVAIKKQRKEKEAGEDKDENKNTSLYNNDENELKR